MKSFTPDQIQTLHAGWLGVLEILSHTKNEQLTKCSAHVLVAKPNLLQLNHNQDSQSSSEHTSSIYTPPILAWLEPLAPIDQPLCLSPPRSQHYRRRTRSSWKKLPLIKILLQGLKTFYIFLMLLTKLASLELLPRVAEDLLV